MIKQGTRLYINITNSCNTECPFCCMYSSPQKTTFMPFETFKSIIDNCIGNFELQLEGGEPLLSDKLYLFIEYAISTGRCTKVIILTNGILLGKHIDRLLMISKAYSIQFELKISVNYWLLQKHPGHLKKVSDWAFATKYIPTLSIILNIRKRKEDEWIDKEVEDYGLKSISNSYYFQSYGKLSDSEYDKPVIVQNIDNWRIYASDGTEFGQDLIARSEYEKGLR